MAVYKPKKAGKVGKFYVCEFVYQGKRIKESTGATTRTVALEYEKTRKRELERAAAGLPTQQKATRIRTVNDVVKPYLEGYKLNHRPMSVVFATGCLAHVTKELGNVILSDLTDDRIRQYIRKRQSDKRKASGRTINMELGELSRAIGKPWSQLWPKVRKLEERKDIGKALSTEEQDRLVAALKRSRTPHLRTFVPLLLMTGMRHTEATTLTWQQVDLLAGHITVGIAKNSSGTGRIIPVNPDLAAVFACHRREFVEAFGEPRPDHYVFPWGSPMPTDPCRHVVSLKHGWETLRTLAGVHCRTHDLRHTFATRLAEAGVPESTMLALMGHMSRRMLERYSHIRMKAKRDAVAGISLTGKPETSPTLSPTTSPLSKIQ